MVDCTGRDFYSGRCLDSFQHSSVNLVQFKAVWLLQLQFLYIHLFPPSTCAVQVLENVVHFLCD